MHANALEIVLPFLIELGAVPLQQFLAEAVDTAGGGTQVVGGRIAECLQLPVRSGQLSGPLLNALLQFRVEPAEFVLCLLLLGNVVDVEEDHGAVVIVAVNLAGVEKHYLATNLQEFLLQLKVDQRQVVGGDLIQQGVW